MNGDGDSPDARTVRPGHMVGYHQMPGAAFMQADHEIDWPARVKVEDRYRDAAVQLGELYHGAGWRVVLEDEGLILIDRKQP